MESFSSALAPGSLTQRFQSYFSREVAEKAARTIADGSEIEFRVAEPGAETLETFTFTRIDGKNAIRPSTAEDAQLVFTMTPQAAEAILADPSEDIGHIGVGILKLIISQDPARKVQIKVRVGFLALFAKGYLGVVTAGGGAFAAFLASRGFDGINGIKAAFRKLRD
jgi:hypothetical protein